MNYLTAHDNNAQLRYDAETGQSFFLPSREWIQGLEVSDSAMDPFGKWRKVVKITAQQDDVNGFAFVCFALDFTNDSGKATITGSAKESHLGRDMQSTRNHTSAELDVIQARLVTVYGLRVPVSRC